MNTTSNNGTPLAEDRPYFELLDAIQTPILVHRGGPILFANKALEKLTGYPQDELIGTPFYTVVHPDSRELAQQRGGARMRGEPVPSVYEFQLMTVDKNVQRWVELTASLLTLNGLPTIVAALYDLTERREAEARQKHLRQVMAQIIDGDPVPTF
ncbi:MAG: PAS domain S-box protein, partial [Betaproteobacteria bacterium]|nr:PAS domain S-box protein [Candidatus Proximibacter danicus]